MNFSDLKDRVIGVDKDPTAFNRFVENLAEKNLVGPITRKGNMKIFPVELEDYVRLAWSLHVFAEERLTDRQGFSMGVINLLSSIKNENITWNEAYQIIQNTKGTKTSLTSSLLQSLAEKRSEVNNTEQ